MNDRQINTFLTLAKCGSFSRAEKELYISKQAAIKQMDTLEAEIGVKLLNRARNGVSLTKAGNSFLKDAEEIRTLTESAVHRCRALVTPASLRIMVPNHPKLLLEKPVKSFSEKYPDVLADIRINTGEDPIEAVRKGIVDVAEIAGDDFEVRNDQIFIPLVEIPYAVMMAPSHELSGMKTVRPEDLKGKTVAVNRLGWKSQILPCLEQIPDVKLKEYPDVNELQAVYNSCYASELYVVCAYYARYLSPLRCAKLEVPFQHCLGLLINKESGKVVTDFVETARKEFENYTYFEE